MADFFSASPRPHTSRAASTMSLPPESNARSTDVATFANIRCHNDDVRQLKFALGICCALTLAACGGGSPPAAEVQQPAVPVPEPIQLKAPDAFALEAGSDGSFEITVNDGVTSPIPAYEASLVFPAASGLTVTQVGLVGYSGRRVLTVRAGEETPVGITNGVLTITQGKTSKSVSIMVNVKAKSPGSFYSSFGQDGLARVALPSGAGLNRASDVAIDTQGRLLVLG